MKRNYWVLMVLVVSCILLLQVSCQGQAGAAEEAKPDSAAAEPVAPAKAETAPEVNELGPKIKIEESIHDFGEIGPGTSNACEFKFTNAGDKLLQIKKIHAPCGCTVPKLSKKEYAPGESGLIKVKFKSPKRQGPVAKNIYVKSNDKNNRRVTLTVKATVVLKVGFEPKRLNLLLNKENAGCPEITLTSLDDRPFAINRFAATGNSITVDYDPSVKATKFVLQPKVNIEKLRKGLEGNIMILLTHPECDEIIIPFKALAEFKTDPSLLNILEAEPQKPVKRELWILNNYGEDFEVESTSSKKGIIKVLRQEKILDKEKYGDRYEFELEITPPADNKGKIFTDVFFVNIKGGKRLEINCRGFYARK